MESYDVKRLALVLSVQARIEGMKAENMQRQHLGQSMAYNDVDFVDLSDYLKVLAGVSDENLQEYC